MTATPLWNLLAWIVQVGILALAAAVVTRVIHVDAPVARYAWWRAVLVVCLALPVIQPWRMPASPDSGLSAPAQGLAAPRVSTSIETGSAAAPAEGVQAAEPRWTTVIAIVLVAGALLRLAWLAGGLVRLRRLRYAGVQATADAADTPDFVHSLTDAGAEVRYVPLLRQPVTFGLRRPFVLLPEMLRAMDPGVQRAVLAHELWHVKRRDWLWNLVEEVLRSALWFHPAIWFLVSQVQSAREEVVDELAILSTNSRRSYLEALLAFADEPAVYPAAPFARRRQLFNRMMLISKEAVMSSRRIVASSAGMAGVLLLTGWYGALAFPLTATPAGGAGAQAQPRDPRPGTPGPSTSREQKVQADLTADPSNLKGWLELAKLQEERGAFTDAEASYKSALTAGPDRSDLLASLAAYFNRTGQFDKAVATLEVIAAQNPTDPSGYQLVATYYWEKAQRDQRLTPADKLMYLEAGIRASDRALALRPDYVEALTYKNIMLRMKANMETDATRRQALIAEADALRTRAMELARQRPPSPPPPPVGARAGAGAPPPPPPPPPPSEYYQVDGQQALRVGGQIPVPTKIRDARPAYPQEALDARIMGMVIIEAVIDTQGAVRSARVLRSVPALDRAALDAVRQWKFAPTAVEGGFVPVIMTVTVNFTLE